MTDAIAPLGIPPPGIAPPAFPPPDIAAPGIAAPGIAPPGMADPGIAPPGIAPPDIVRGIAPPGMHSATLWAQWHPYHLADGLRWQDVAEKAAEDVVAEVDAVAPGFAGSVVGAHVQTPWDLEHELGLHRGNVMRKMQLASVGELVRVWEVLPADVRGKVAA